jgi:hypothetical protein
MSNNGNRQAVNEALRALPHAQRTRILQDSLDAALGKLPDEQSRKIVDLANELAKKMNKLGPATAIEVLAAIGILWSENGHGK